jgi:hypothetical protein
LSHSPSPSSKSRLTDKQRDRFPGGNLFDRIRYLEQDIEAVSLFPSDLVVSVHACGVRIYLT